MKKHLLLIILLIYSCITPKNAINKFTFCFSNEKTGLEKLIDLNGYYYLINTKRKTKEEGYTFYNNGFSEYASGEYWLDQTKASSKYGTFGIYQIKNDTIKIQYITSPRATPSGTYKVWFKILNHNSIKMIYTGNLKHVTKEALNEFKLNQFYINRGTIFKFHPLEKKPEIDQTYIINKNWFWCNDENFKKWKNEKK